MEAAIVNQKIKEEFILPDEAPPVDCSCVKEEPDESCVLDKDDDNELSSNSSSGRLEGLGASLAVIKMEMDLPDSSVSQEIIGTGELNSNRYCSACGILYNSEEDFEDHCQIVHSDTFMEIRRKNGEKLNETAIIRPTGLAQTQANPGRTVISAMCLYNCNACCFTSLSKHDVLEHMNSHIEVRILSCEFCLPLFHDEGVKALGVIPYSCGHCLFRTEDLEEMRNHSMLHHKAVTFLSEMESEDYVSTSQSQHIFHETLRVQKDETGQSQMVDDEVCVEAGRKYNLNKENVCSPLIIGDVVNGTRTGRNHPSSNRGLVARDIQTPSLPVIPRAISLPKQNSIPLKVPPGNNQVILVDKVSDGTDVNPVVNQDKFVVNDNPVVSPRKSQRILRPKLERHLANPDPPYYLRGAEPSPFSYTVHPLNTESVPPILPITVASSRIAVSSTTDGSQSQNSNPKKHRKHHKKKCPYCGREARDNYCLKVHMLTHSKEKPFACPYEYCSYRATQKAHVMKHLQSERHMSTHRGQNISSDSS